MQYYNMYIGNKGHVCKEGRLSVIMDEKAADLIWSLWADLKKKKFWEGNIYAALSGILYNLYQLY